MITNSVDLNLCVTDELMTMPLGNDRRVAELHIERLLNGLSDDVIKMLSVCTS